MLTHHCKEKVDCEERLGRKIDESHYDLLISGDQSADVYKADGEPLIYYRPKWFSQELVHSIIPACRKAAKPTDNRGNAAGSLDGDVFIRAKAIKKNIGSSLSYRRVKEDKTISKTNRSGEVKSGIIGYFNRTPRHPFCRQTAFLISEAASWEKFLPYIIRADEGFKEFAPERWKAQREFANRTASDFVISGSTFTTVTVNRNFQTATHRDAGDLAEGFGVMSCIRNQKFGGGYLCFPEHRVAVDLSSGSLCLANVHELHANTPLKDMQVGYERISLVFYYREKMIRCMKSSEEEALAKKRGAGSSLR